MNQDDIKQKIEKVIEKCSDPEIYSNIIKDIFTIGIDKPGTYLNSLEILPNLNEKQLKKNFEANKKILCDFINQQKRDSIFYQIFSCIFGAFTGDAIGGFCEFMKYSKSNYKKIFKEMPVFQQLPGQITDDSEMAMCLAYAIMDNPKKETIDPNYIYFYYGSWAKSEPIDMGFTTENAFKDFDFVTFHPKLNNFKNVQNEISKDNYNSLSNGFLMRKSTLIAWIYNRFFFLINQAFDDTIYNNNNKYLIELYEKIKEISHIDNIITHPNIETDVVSAFYSIMVLGAIKLLEPQKIIKILLNLCNDNYFSQKGNVDLKLARNIIFYIEQFKNKKFDFYNYFGKEGSNNCVYKHMGWYEHALKLTLYFLVNFDNFKINDLYKNILEQICNLGGDTDTNCCIVGAVIGPLIGLQNFGDYFKKVLDVIPRDRYIFSICIMVIYVKYLYNSNRNNDILNNECYFLKSVLTLLYGEIEID